MVANVTLAPRGGDVHSRNGFAASGPDRLGGMHPRYRRMVIPGALAALILIVAVASLARR